MDGGGSSRSDFVTGHDAEEVELAGDRGTTSESRTGVSRSPGHADRATAALGEPKI